MQFGEVNIKGQFDDTIQGPPAPIIPSNQPPNIERLTQMSGKSPNAVKVEYEQKLREMENKQVQNATLNFDGENKSDKEQIEIAAFNELADEYKNGTDDTDEDDEVTYDDLTAEVADDMGQDPAAGDFNLFPPNEQDSANQMFADIDAINANEPMLNENESFTDEDNIGQMSMDDLKDIAEPDDDGVEEIPDVPDVPEV